MAEFNENIGGIDIAYKVIGSGKPLLLLHGWGGSGDSMMPLALYFSKFFSVYLPDFPGFGNSAQPKSDWNVADYSCMLVELINRIGIRGCDVIAHSFGCRVSILTAAKNKGIFGKLIFTGAAGLIPKRNFKYYYKVYTYKLLKRIYSLGLFKKAGDKFRANAGSDDYKALNDTMKRVFVNVVNQDLRGYLKDIDNSTLLIWGENDVDTPLYFGRIMEAEINDSGLVILPDTGHFAYLENLQAFIKISANFLGAE